MNEQHGSNESAILTVFGRHGQRPSRFLKWRHRVTTYTGRMRSTVLGIISAAIRAFGVLFVVLSTAATGVFAAPVTTDALLNAGKKLTAEAKCEACHASKLGGDGSAMYSRADRRVNTKSALLVQVSRCNNELSLGLFPDDEVAIAAYLNAAYYKFKQ